MADIFEGWDAINLIDNPADQPERPVDDADALIARVFSTSDGQKLMAGLREKFLEQPAWYAGSDPSLGYVREGQNSVVRYLENAIRRATEPK